MLWQPISIYRANSIRFLLWTLQTVYDMGQSLLMIGYKFKRRLFRDIWFLIRLTPSGWSNSLGFIKFINLIYRNMVKQSLNVQPSSSCSPFEETKLNMTYGILKILTLCLYVHFQCSASLIFKFVQEPVPFNLYAKMQGFEIAFFRNISKMTHAHDLHVNHDNHYI